MCKRKGNIFAVFNMLEYIKWGLKNQQFKKENVRILSALIDDMLIEIECYIKRVYTK